MVVPRLQALGYEVVVFELGGKTNVPTQIGNVKILPPALDLLGNDIILEHAAHTQAIGVISFTDTWALAGHIWGKTGYWYPLVPIDHTPAPDGVVNSVRHAKRPLAISRFGQKELGRAGIQAGYLPCVYDPSIWYPGDKRQARKLTGLPEDRFIVGFVGVNDSCPSRKGIPELLSAWSMYSRTNPQALLYLHTSRTGNVSNAPHNGVNIDEIILKTGIHPQTVILPEDYRYRTGIPAEQLAWIARAIDVLVLPSRGEGFGLPLVEFQACGCPVITTDFASQSELCFGGWKIDYEPDWTWQGAFMAKAGLASLCEALLAAGEERDNPARKAEAIEGAAAYQVDTIVRDYWAPLLNEMAESYLLESV